MTREPRYFCGSNFDFQIADVIENYFRKFPVPVFTFSVFSLTIGSCIWHENKQHKDTQKEINPSCF